MRILYALTLVLSHALYSASDDSGEIVSLRGFINKLGITPECIKFPEEADYTKHQYPEKLNISMETLTQGIVAITRAVSKILIKASGDSNETDFFKCMICAEIVSEFTQVMHTTYMEEAHNFMVDAAFQLKKSQQEDVLIGCEKRVGQQLRTVQKRATDSRAFIGYLEKFRVAQNQYPQMTSAKCLKAAVRDVFVEADNLLRQEALSKHPELQVGRSFAEFIATKKQTKVDARGLKTALEYLKSRGPSDLSTVVLSTHIV